MEVGTEGKCSDATLYNNSDLFAALEQNTCKKPADEPIEPWLGTNASSTTDCQGRDWLWSVHLACLLQGKKL